LKRIAGTAGREVPVHRREDPLVAEGGACAAPLAQRRSLRSFIRRIVSRPWDADDIVQEAYLRLLEHPPPRGRDPQSIPRYLFVIARNLVADRGRRLQRESRRSAALAAIAAQLDNNAPGADELAFVDQASERLSRALAELPERARDAFLLHRLEGLGYAAISTQLGVTTRTVERDIAAALCHLKRNLFTSEEP
jgi:RNA polymerase sigma-70 factor (ECF subfamily)